MDLETIYNMTLSHISQGVVTDITGVNDVAAEKCNLFYDSTRQWLLRHFPWGFAKTPEALVASTDTIPGWPYVYEYPASALRVWRITTENGASGMLLPYYDSTGMNYYAAGQQDNSSNPLMFDRYGDKLVAGIEDAWAVYSADVTDFELFDNMFTETLSWRLAYEVAMPITGKYVQRDKAYEGFMMSMAAASAASGMERRVQNRVGYDTVEARR